MTGKRKIKAAVAGLVLAILVLALAGLYLGRENLFYLTGEEEFPKQLTALAQLGLGVFRPPLELANDAPVRDTGLSPYGVNTFLQNEVEPEKREKAVRLAAEAGFKWMRQEFPWQDIEIHGKGDFEDRRNPPYRSAWDKYDQIVSLAEKYEMQLIVRLSTPPSWSRAAGDSMGTFAPPDNVKDYGDFAEAVARRYLGRVHYYQIWNEPNIYPEWGKQPVDAAAYVKLLKEGYTRIKAVDPQAVIISGALAATIELDRYPHGLSDVLFLEQMYAAGAQPYFDVLAMQGYGLWSGPYDRRMQPRVMNFSRPLYVRDVMVRHGDANKAIWLSEVAWNAPPPDLPDKRYGMVTEQQQARYAVLAYQRIQQEMPWLGVANYWFLKQASDQEKLDGNPQYYFRLLEPDFTPLPVYEALKQAAHQPAVMYPGNHSETHRAISYQGQWETVNDGQAVLGSFTRSPAGEASLSFDFSGTDLALILTRYPGSLDIPVYLDGSYLKLLHLETDTPEYQVKLQVAQGLARGIHHLELKIPAQAGRPPFGLDACLLTDDPLPPLLGKAAGLAAVLASLAAVFWLGRKTERRA